MNDDFSIKILEFKQKQKSLKFELKMLMKEHVKYIVGEKCNLDINIEKLDFVKIDNSQPGSSFKKIYSDSRFVIWINHKINRVKYVDVKKLNKLIKICQ